MLKLCIGEGEKQFVGGGEAGKFIQARSLGGHGLGRKGHQTLPTQERDSYRASTFYAAYKGECQSWRPTPGGGELSEAVHVSSFSSMIFEKGHGWQNKKGG